MEYLVVALLVVVVVEAMLVFRFKRRADLLKSTMERDRETLMRKGHPATRGRPPEPVVGRSREGAGRDEPSGGEGEGAGEEGSGQEG